MSLVVSAGYRLFRVRPEVELLLIRSSKQGAPIIGVRYSQCQWKHWIYTAKAIADKVDYGSILLNVKDEDMEALEPILSSNIFEKPTIKMSVYKNRRGRYKGVILWCKADLGCCRIKPMFCTTYDYEMVAIENVKIIVEEESAFETK